MIRKISDYGVVEIIETIILLSLAIIVISFLSLTVLSDLDSEEETHVTISGQVKSTNLILEHLGGESLGLDTQVILKIAGDEYSDLVGNYLEDTNNDNRWNIGERMIYPFQYDLSKLRNYTVIDIVAINKEGNEIVLKGPVELFPVSDIGIEMNVGNLFPEIGDIVTFTITVTCYGGEVNGSSCGNTLY